MLLGECMPASCDARAVNMLLGAAEASATESAANLGLEASFSILKVRPVPGDYNLFADPKLHILG